MLRRRPPRPAPRRLRRARVAAVAGIAVVGLAAAGCVGQHSRNDDHVGPFSYRPDAREHTLAPAGTPAT